MALQCIYQMSNGRRTPKAFLGCLTIMSYLLLGIACTEIETGVVWSPSDSKVVNSAIVENITFELVNPCTMLAPKFHIDLQTIALNACHSIYKDVLADLEQWCPKQTLSRIEREPTLMILGIIALGTAIVVGFQVHGVKNQIDELQKHNKAMEDFTRDIENQIKNFDERFNNFTQHYNLLVSKVQMFYHDYHNLKTSHVSSTFETNWFITNLHSKMMAIRRASRLWKSGKFSMSLLDVFELELPCSNEECPQHLITPHSCSFSGGNKVGLSSQISLIINIPKVDMDIVAMSAHAFDLVVPKGDKICVAQYNGPKTVFMSKSKHCQIHGLDLDIHGDKLGYLSLYHENTCLLPNGKHKFYNITECLPKSEFNSTEYVQVKFLNNEVYLYCPGGNFKVKGVTRECSNHVMVLPFSSDISVNGIPIVSSQTLSKRVDFVGNLHNAAVYQIPMHLNFTDAEFHDKGSFKHIKYSDYYSTVFKTAGISTFTIVLIISITIGVIYLFFKYKRFVSCNL